MSLFHTLASLSMLTNLATSQLFYINKVSQNGLPLLLPYKHLKSQVTNNPVPYITRYNNGFPSLSPYNESSNGIKSELESTGFYTFQYVPPSWIQTLLGNKGKCRECPPGNLRSFITISSHNVSCCKPAIPDPATPDPSSCKCGIKNKRIVGGTNAEEFSWPWITRLSVTYPKGNYLCGGSLIADQWILTAAHCVIPSPDLPTVTVYLGDHDIGVTDDNEKVLQASEIINHAGYDAAASLNDIALLKLNEKVDLEKYTPICLPKAGSKYVGKLSDVYGWGTISSGGPTSDILQETSVEVITNTACIAQGNNDVTSNQICAFTAGKDSCQGDSGGPLSYNNNNKHQQIGVVSYGDGCGTNAGVYTRVTEYLDWIKMKTEAVYCDA